MQRILKIAVVGGGVMGASATWHLARAGASVTLIDRDSGARNDATASSFGWVGTGASLPSENPSAFDLHLGALQEFARLQQGIGPLPIAVRGALIWWSTEEVTVTFLNEQQAAGVRMESISGDVIPDWEPHLASKPPLAAWAPDDFAIEPADLASQLVTAARTMEAKVHGGEAEMIETAHGRVIGVRVKGEMIPADVVVLANGFGARSLAAELGAALPLYESPAVLMRFATETGLLRHLLCGSGLELRPTLGGGMCSAADFPENGKDGLPTLAAEMTSSISQLLHLSTPPKLLSIRAAPRPMTTTGTPFRGFVGEAEGVYAMVAHPGVTLAPLLGRLAADEIMNP